MINHARTLLLNRNGAAQQNIAFYGAEYVPANYSPVPISGTLQAVWQILFSANADDAFMNYRLWQYMRILHSTEFVQYVTALDPRVTYSMARSLLTYPYGITITPLSTAARNLLVLGQPDNTAADGCLLGQWTITTAPDEIVNVAYKGQLVSSTAAGWNGKKSSIIPLPMKGSNLFCCIICPTGNFIPLSLGDITSIGTRGWFTAGGVGNIASIATGGAWSSDEIIEAPSWVEGASWSVESLMYPSLPLQTVVESLMSVTTLDEIFAFNDPTYAVFQQLWDYHDLLAYRLSGLLLAVIYQMEAQRTNG